MAGRRHLALLLLVLEVSTLAHAIDFSVPYTPTNFYRTECPRARRIVGDRILRAVIRDLGMPAALLRMQFHDCFVRGCDASILIQSNETNLAEKDGVGNAFSVRGYELIDDIKARLEEECPGVVSCADIIALASRDAVAVIDGPWWKVTSGRRDGEVSIAAETVRNLPPPFGDYFFLVDRFQRKGFTEKEMVVLSGAHTFGITHCGVIENRLYNSTGPGGVDPSLDADFAAQLKRQCPFGSSNAMREVALDPSNGGNAFDGAYFRRVQNNKGVFTSDAALITTASGRALVAQQALNSRAQFFADFALAMEKMSDLEVLRAPNGQVRRHCRFVN